MAGQQLLAGIMPQWKGFRQLGMATGLSNNCRLAVLKDLSTVLINRTDAGQPWASGRDVQYCHVEQRADPRDIIERSLRYPRHNCSVRGKEIEPILRHTNKTMNDDDTRLLFRTISELGWGTNQRSSGVRC